MLCLTLRLSSTYLDHQHNQGHADCAQGHDDEGPPSSAGHYLDLWSHQLTRDVVPLAIDYNLQYSTIQKTPNFNTEEYKIQKTKSPTFNTAEPNKILNTPTTKQERFH